MQFKLWYQFRLAEIVGAVPWIVELSIFGSLDLSIGTRGHPLKIPRIGVVEILWYGRFRAQI